VRTDAPVHEVYLTSRMICVAGAFLLCCALRMVC
jgi:hypothetical protein